MARKPTPKQEIRAGLAAELAELQRHSGGADPMRRGKATAEQKDPRPESRHTRALVNAVAVGPGRETPDERRLILARLLAQRAQREAERPGAWSELIQKLVGEIEELEDQIKRARQRLAETGQTFDPKVLDSEEERLRMQLVEHYVYVVDRMVAAQAVQQRDAAHREAELKDFNDVDEQAINTTGQGEGGNDGE